MSYHLTTSISAENIYNNGMDPSKKEKEVLEDIDSLASVLSPENRDYFMPYALNDKGTYSYASFPKLAVNYGRRPEWYLNLTLYNDGTADEIFNSISPFLVSESDEAKEKMYNVISKYHDLYANSSRTLVVIPGLNNVLSDEALDSFGVKDVPTLRRAVEHLVYVRHSINDGDSTKCVPGSDLMFIDVKSRSLVDFESKEKSK